MKKNFLYVGSKLVTCYENKKKMFSINLLYVLAEFFDLELQNQQTHTQKIMHTKRKTVEQTTIITHIKKYRRKSCIPSFCWRYH